MATSGTWKVYYDAGCNVCHHSQLRMVKWAQKRGQSLEAIPLQSEEAAAKGYADEMVVEIDGKPFFRHEGWAQVLKLAPWYLRWVGVFSGTAPFRWTYNFVAKWRYRLFGRRTCPIPKK